MRRLLTAAVALCLLTAASVAMAGREVGRDPSGGWGQWFQENGWYGGVHHNFDHIQVFISSGPVTFAPTGMKNFSAGGWAGVYTTPSMAIAEGPSVGYLQWDFIWNDEPANFTMQYQAWNGNTLIGSETIVYDDGWLYTTPGTWNASRIEHLPEPMSILLGSLGLGSVAGFARLRRRRA